MRFGEDVVSFLSCGWFDDSGLDCPWPIGLSVNDKLIFNFGEV